MTKRLSTQPMPVVLARAHGVTPHQTALRRSLVLLLSVAALSACSGTLLPKPPPAPARYLLDAVPVQPQPVARAPHASPLALAVVLPRAAPGYDSRRMLYLRQPQQLEAFAFHEWVDAPAQMLAPLLVRALQDREAFNVVLLAPSSARAGWRLETELLRLHQDFTTRPSQLRLGVRAVLLDVASQRVVAWQAFDLAVVADGDDPVAGARAANAAVQQLMQAVAAFCEAQAAQNARPAAAAPGAPGD